MKQIIILLIVLLSWCAWADCYNETTAVQDEYIGTQMIDTMGCSMVETKEDMPLLTDAGMFGIVILIAGGVVLAFLLLLALVFRTFFGGG